MQTEKSKPNPKQPKDLARVTSESLLGEKRELVIVHNGREYRLRLTQNDKLILTA
ncbi:MAG: hemin uptake protein HemP [Betaproteobacteria bacterium]